MSRRAFEWALIFGTGLVLFLLSFFGAFTITSCGSTPSGQGGLCIGFVGYDILLGIVGLVLVIVGGVKLSKLRDNQ